MGFASRRRTPKAKRQFTRKNIKPRRFRRGPRFDANVRTGGFIGIERKFADFETNDDAFAVTWATMEDGTIKSVGGVAQGNTESQRIGRKYSILSIHIRAFVKVAAAEANVNVRTDLRGRFCLVLDTQTNAAQLDATDVMDGGQTDDTLAFRNLQFSKRFLVLWDQAWILKHQQMAQGGVDLFSIPDSHSRMFKFNKVFAKPLQITCNSTATTNVISVMEDNSLHMIGVANDTSALLSYQVRIRFAG